LLTKLAGTIPKQEAMQSRAKRIKALQTAGPGHSGLFETLWRAGGKREALQRAGIFLPGTMFNSGASCNLILYFFKVNATL
jgi:hypothetical protein